MVHQFYNPNPHKLVEQSVASSITLAVHQLKYYQLFIRVCVYTSAPGTLDTMKSHILSKSVHFFPLYVSLISCDGV